MKRSLPRSRLCLSKLSSFTLVELLVVIGIIAILAGVLLSAGATVLKMAKRSKAATMASQIQTASMAYYTEYGIYPVPPTSPAKDYYIGDTPAGTDQQGVNNKTAWGTLMCILCGNIQPYTATAFTTAGATITNSHGVAFLTAFKTTDVDTYNAPLNPLLYVTGATTNNAYFNIAIDGDYDGLLGTTSPTSGLLPNFSKSTVSAMDLTGTSTAGVAVWENCNGSATSKNPNWWVHTY